MVACEKHKIKRLAGCLCRASCVLLAIGKENNKQNNNNSDDREKRDGFFASPYRSVIEWKKAGLEQAFTNRHRTEQFGYISRSKLVHLYQRTTKRENIAKVNLKKRYILEITIELC